MSTIYCGKSYPMLSWMERQRKICFFPLTMQMTLHTPEWFRILVYYSDDYQSMNRPVEQTDSESPIIISEPEWHTGENCVFSTSKLLLYELYLIGTFG